MGLLIDASILIEHERGRVDLRFLLQGLGNAEAYLSAVTASEMLHGVHRTANPVKRAQREASVEGLLSAFPVLPVDVDVARIHALLWAGLSTAGTPIGLHDLWIAATCLAHGHAIVTANVREFTRVPGLAVHSPN